MAPGLRAENVPVPQWGDAGGDEASGGKEMLLQGKVAVVTGGDSGIGRAIAIGMARAGASVTINYHSNQQAADEVRQQIEQDGGMALAVQGDVADVADLQHLVDETARQFGRLDIMVNNAGME